jgi:predicted nucleic acid-binding protein
VKRILVDAGPIVAILSRADAYHETCIRSMHALTGPLLSCWPVIAEAAWILRHTPMAVQQLMQSVGDDGFLELLPLAGAEGKAIAAIMRRYEDLHPQLADVALVHLANREQIDTVFTLDRRDFSVYRYGHKRAFRIVPDLE